jgi:hypothetical protein
VRQTDLGDVKTNSYIPEKYAKLNWILKLKNSDDTWTDGWIVVAAGELVEGKFVENQAHNSDCIWDATSGKYPRGNK